MTAPALAYGGRLLPQHADMLAASGISPDLARARGYVSVDTKTRLEQIGVTFAGRNVPGLLIPLLRKDGSTWGWQYRPDTPRVRDGKPVKYETPVKQRNGLDVPPTVGGKLGDPTVPLWVTEGSKKADAAASRGLACVALLGVWSWRGRNSNGGRTAIPDWHDVALNGRRVILAFDSDVMRKRAVRAALTKLAGYLASKGADVAYCHLPDSDTTKTGLDDYLAAGHNVTDLSRLVHPEPPPVVDLEPAPEPQPQQTRKPPRRMTIGEAVNVFQRWLYLPDTDPLLAIAAAAVANRWGGASAVWLLIIGPPSSGKTEQIAPLTGLPEAILAATVTEASLLSGTAKKDRASDATGGLLREIGERGLLVMKDFTSVLAQNRDARGQALAALREIHDGHWSRALGVDGAKRLEWSGKVGLIAGCTNAYDQHHQVISELGDRFVTLRLADNDADPEQQAMSVGLAALAHASGDEGEQTMRAELRDAMVGLIESADPEAFHRPLTRDEQQQLVNLAHYAGLSRTPVSRNPYTGDLTAIPTPEGPGRLTVAYHQLLAGLRAIGADEQTCWRILRRLARDAAPAMRGKVLRALITSSEYRRTSDLAQAAGLVTKTTDRILDDLRLLHLAHHDKQSDADHAPNVWAPTDLLLKLYPHEGGPPTPQSETEMYLPARRATEEEGGVSPTSTGAPFTGIRTSLSYFPAGAAQGNGSPPGDPAPPVEVDQGDPPPDPATPDDTPVDPDTCPDCGRPWSQPRQAVCRQPWRHARGGPLDSLDGPDPLALCLACGQPWTGPPGPGCQVPDAHGEAAS